MSSSNLIDKIIFNDILDSNTKAIYRETVEIFNNETFTLDFDGITFNSNQEGVDNVQLLKANIDWGDGSTETIYKRLYSSTSSIGGYETSSWKRITHMYNTDKKNVYLTDDVRALPKITITLYNTFNDCVKIYIPYKLVYKSIYDLGTSFKMLSANISNDNHSSFVIKNKNDDSMMIVGVKNWKKIYGEDDIVYIDDDNVSKDYADQFVNEDSMVWDWDAVPQIALNVKVMSDGQISWFECDFSEKTVNLDYWQPHCYLMKDNDEELKQIVINQSLRKFFIYNTVDSVRKPLDIGMFKIFVKMVGVNGVEGISNVQYIKSDDLFFADKLRLPYPFIDQFYTKASNDKSITFNYTLPQYAYPTHIDSAKVHLQAIRIDEEDDGIQKGTEEEYINSFVEPNYDLSFTYDLSFNEKNEEQYYTTTLSSNSIPNGIYDVTIEVRQKTKTLDDASQKNIYTYKEDENGFFENVVYKIPSLTLNYNGVGSVTFDEKPQVSIDDLKITWNVSDAIEMRDILYRLSKLTEDSKIESYIIDKRQNYQNYNFEQQGKKYIFQEHIKPNEINDGKYRIEVGHVIPMSDYVGQRQIVLNQQIDFQYITPKMEVKSFIPYLKRNGDKLVPTFRVQIEDEFGEQVGGVEYTITHPQGKSIELLGEKLIHDIPYYGQTFSFNVKSYNLKDDIYKRKRKNPSENNVVQELSIPNEIQNVMFFNQNVTPTVTYVKQKDGTEIFGSNLTRNSIYNIPKKYKWVVNDDIYYSYDLNPNYFSCNGVTYPCLFKTESYRQKFNNNKKILRFVPNVQFIDNLNDITPQTLPTVKDYLDEKQIMVDYKYNRNIDKCQLTIGSRFSVYEKDPIEVNDAVVTLYKNGERIYTTNIRNNFQTAIGSLETGKYDLGIQFHSLNTDNTSDYVYLMTSDTTNGLNLLVNDNQVLSHSHYISRGIDNSKYFNIEWSLYHKGLKNLDLHTQLTREYIYQWHAYETQLDVNGNPLQMYQFETDSEGNYIYDEQGKLIPKYVIDENGDKQFIYVTFKDNGRDTGIPKPMPKFKFQDYSFVIDYLYEKDKNGNYIKDENGQKIPVMKQEPYMYKIIDNVTVCPHLKQQNVTNQSYEIPIILQSKDEISYWFQFQGDYIKWSDDNPNHRLPFKKNKIVIS